MNLDFAQNKTKLRRIMDKMPNATVEELKAEYIKQGGLLTKVENEIYKAVVDESYNNAFNKPAKKSVVKTVKEKVVKAVKKVSKKK